MPGAGIEPARGYPQGILSPFKIENGWNQMQILALEYRFSDLSYVSSCSQLSLAPAQNTHNFRSQFFLRTGHNHHGHHNHRNPSDRFAPVMRRAPRSRATRSVSLSEKFDNGIDSEHDRWEQDRERQWETCPRRSKNQRS